MGGPAESKESKAARLRERRISELEQQKSDQEASASLTTDFRAAFQRPTLFDILKKMRGQA